MALDIEIYVNYTTTCLKRIKVPDDFKIEGSNAAEVYENLCERFPEDPICEIEDGMDSDDVWGDDNEFDGIGYIEIRNSSHDVVMEIDQKKVKTIKKQNPVTGRNLNKNNMKRKCKHLIDSRSSMNKVLYNSCLELEEFVESLGNQYKIGNTLSDFQPSYEVNKKVNDRLFVFTINPRLKSGEVFFFVRDDYDDRGNVKVSIPEVLKSGEIPEYPIGSLRNQYIWDFESLKKNIENIDMSKGCFVNP
jgi:hypothetical protein